MAYCVRRYPTTCGTDLESLYVLQPASSVSNNNAERIALFGRRGLQVGVAPRADLQPAADPAQRFGAVRSNGGGADFTLIFALRRFHSGGAVGACQNLVGNDLLILGCGFSLHICFRG